MTRSVLLASQSRPRLRTTPSSSRSTAAWSRSGWKGRRAANSTSLTGPIGSRGGCPASSGPCGLSLRPRRASGRRPDSARSNRSGPTVMRALGASRRVTARVSGCGSDSTTTSANSTCPTSTCATVLPSSSSSSPTAPGSQVGVCTAVTTALSATSRAHADRVSAKHNCSGSVHGERRTTMRSTPGRRCSARRWSSRSLRTVQATQQFMSSSTVSALTCTPFCTVTVRRCTTCPSNQCSTRAVPGTRRVCAISSVSRWPATTMTGVRMLPPLSGTIFIRRMFTLQSTTPVVENHCH